MGVFIEDLLHFGNLIDKEIQIELSPAQLEEAYKGYRFEIEGGLLKIATAKRVLFWNRLLEVRLSEGGGVRKERETLRQWVFLKVLSRSGLQELLKCESFRLEGEHLAMEVMPAVVLTETYERIPKQFREKLLISRYKIGKDRLSLFFKFEK